MTREIRNTGTRTRRTVNLSTTNPKWSGLGTKPGISRCLNMINVCYSVPTGDRGSTVVKVLCYKSGGRWFDPR